MISCLTHHCKAKHVSSVSVVSKHALSSIFESRLKLLFAFLKMSFLNFVSHQTEAPCFQQSLYVYSTTRHSQIDDEDDVRKMKYLFGCLVYTHKAVYQPFSNYMLHM